MTFDLDVAYPGMGLPAFWKSLFPNWPDELINKFSQGISIDAPKFGFAGGGAGQRGVRVLCQISVGGLPDRVYR